MIIFYFSGFFFLFIYFLKEFFFLSSLFYFDVNILFMICIFTLIMYLMKIPLFNYSNNLERFVYYFIFESVIFFLLLCFSSCKSILFLVLLENCVIFMILFIFFYSKDFDKISSTFFMFFLNIAPSISFMYFCTVFSESIYLTQFSLHEYRSLFLFICFLGLLLSKLPLFLLHFWLTKAHVSASGCGSMILASLMLKIGTMGLLKFFSGFSNISKSFSSFSFFFVSWSMIVLLSAMIRFFDLKYLVACSSIVHMSPIFCLCIFGGSESIFSIMLMMVGHGLISYLIFYLITICYELNYHRSMDFNKSFNSVSKIIYMFFFFFFLFNMGFPPFISFLSELFFFHCFYFFDFLTFIFFSFSLMLSGLFFFFFVSKSLFGKKSFMEIYYSYSLNFFHSYFYLFSLIILPFLFF